MSVAEIDMDVKERLRNDFLENNQYERIIKSTDKMSIGYLSKPGYCFAPDEKTEKIYEIMKHNHGITEFVVLTDDNKAEGFMTRNSFNEILGGQYGFTLHSGKPVRRIMKTDFLKVDYNMPIEKVSNLAMKRPFERLYNPIVIEQNGKYSGIVTVKDLLDTCMNIARSERDEIAIMKDSLKIGLFFMDRNYIIQDHYSRYLEEVFSEKDISGKSFIDLLSSSFNAGELDNIRDYFDMVFNRTFDQETIDDINPLAEFYYVNAGTGQKKVFNCNFTVIEENDNSFVLTAVYDVTARVELQQKLAEEENRRQEEMRNVFELLQVDPRVFNDFLEDAEYEFERINKTLKNDDFSAHEAIVEVYQSVHAVKANAAVLKLNTFCDKVHKLESKIKKLRELEDVPFVEMLNLAIDLEKLSIEKDGFKATIEKINSYKSSNNADQGRNVLVELVAKTINKVSEDLGKKINFIADDIDNEALEKGPRRIIKETLIQLARNSVVHGIEKSGERGAKNETGLIKLSIKLKDGSVNVKLSDDGRGLDYKTIAEKALALNLIKPQDAEDKSTLLKVIFTPGFSTAETEGIHAGRGIGLSLVQERVRSAKGVIKVQSEQGKGTTFTICFPVA